MPTVAPGLFGRNPRSHARSSAAGQTKVLPGRVRTAGFATLEATSVGASSGGWSGGRDRRAGARSGPPDDVDDELGGEDQRGEEQRGLDGGLNEAVGFHDVVSFETRRAHPVRTRAPCAQQYKTHTGPPFRPGLRPPTALEWSRHGRSRRIIAAHSIERRSFPHDRQRPRPLHLVQPDDRRSFPAPCRSTAWWRAGARLSGRVPCRT